MTNKALKNAGFNSLASAGFELPLAAEGMVAAEFEAATTGRRLGSWGLSGSGPNSAITGASATLRSRARMAYRNDPHAQSGTESLVANMIGSGIKPRFKIKDKDLKEAVQELWGDWIEESDADGRVPFYGQQEMVSRAVISDGESLVRFRSRRPEDGLSVPLQLQVIEADHLPLNKTIHLSNGNTIKAGIEFNRVGQRVAYHLYRDHPGDGYYSRNNGDVVRVPAADVMHVYHSTRPGQLRGYSWLAPILLKLYEIDQYQDAELVRKKTAAMFGGFVVDTYQGSEDLRLGDEKYTPGALPPTVGLEPGTFPVLPLGKDVRFSDPADVGGNSQVWLMQQLRDVSSGMGCTYEQLTGDLTGVNFTSIRAGLLEFHRRIEMRQRNIITHQTCRPTVRRWMDTAVLSAALRIEDYIAKRRTYVRVNWVPDGWEAVDRLKNIMADRLEIRQGVDSRSHKVAKRGRDVESVDEERKEDRERDESYGNVSDSDAAQTNTSGALQSVEDQVVVEAVTEAISEK